MTTEDVHRAAIDAARHFGPGDQAPLELVQVTGDGASAVYTAAFNDIRARSSSGSVVSVDVDTFIYTNLPAIRLHLINRLAEYLYNTNTN